MRTRWIVTFFVTCLSACSLAQLTTLADAFKELTKRELTQPGAGWITKTSSFPTEAEVAQAATGVVLFTSKHDLGQIPPSLRESLAPTGHPIRAYPLTLRQSDGLLQRTLVVVDTGSTASAKLVSLLFDAHMRQPWGTKPAKELIRASYRALWNDMLTLSPELATFNKEIDSVGSDARREAFSEVAIEATKNIEKLLEDTKDPGKVRFFALLGALSAKEDPARTEQFYRILGFYE